MKPRAVSDRRDDGVTVCEPCRLGEHGHCDGNIDLKGGAGPAVPLTRCMCRCIRGPIQVRRT